jgi:hypothetical protein
MAKLSGANLSRANLWDANLYGADLRGAELSEANLRGANLSGADLLGAKLDGANLWMANLRDNTDLSMANLRGANLRKAVLSGANLRGADLRGADLRGAILDWGAIPLVPNIDAAILSALEGGGTLINRSLNCHFCDTAHSQAGWAVVLAGDAGQKLEEQLGTNAAAALIYARSGSHPVPNWYSDNRTALEDMKSRAQKQLALSQPLSLEEEGIEIG